MGISMFLKNYLIELNNISNTIDPKEFDGFISELIATYERQSNIFVFGNGGSAATASHFACDINKGCSFKRDKRFKIICLNDNISTMLAYANDVSYDEVFVEQLKNFLNPNDLVIGISGSGNSENVLRAMRYANENKAKTFGICGYSGEGKLKGLTNKSIIIKSKDMQKIEDLHMIIFHCAMQCLNNKLAKCN